LDLGRPAQLTRRQVEDIKQKNNGKPVQTETIRLRRKEDFVRDYPLRENDVFLVQVVKEK